MPKNCTYMIAGAYCVNVDCDGGHLCVVPDWMTKEEKARLL